MTYHVLDPESLPATEEYPCDRRSLSAAADLTTLHVATYTLAPGEDLARSYHSHAVREEVLYVLAGTLHVETPDREYAIDAEEAFVVEPTSPFRAFNPDDAAGEVRVLGTGAPKTDPARPYEG